MFKHLLVPTDGSTLSEATVNRAISFAGEAGAKIPPGSRLRRM